MNMLNAIAVASLLALAPAANAVTVDFDTSSGFANSGSFAVDDGFTVSITPASSGSLILVTNQSNLSDNGTNALFLINNGSWTLTETSPTALGFNLLSVELRGSFSDSPERWASRVQLLGTLVAGGTVTADYTPLTNIFTTFTLPSGFAGLSSVAFIPSVNADGGPNNFEFVADNLVIATASPGVPEPATWLQLLLGFGLVGATARRRGLARAIARV